MREILFRGKTLSGAWKYGYFLKSVNFDEDNIAVITDNKIPEYVLKNTIGQYTGLTANGTKVFEGDIVHCKSRLDSADMVVIYENGQFRMVLAEQYNSYQPNMGYYDINCFDKTIIGNIHDNPELLKGAKNET